MYLQGKSWLPGVIRRKIHDLIMKSLPEPCMIGERRDF